MTFSTYSWTGTATSATSNWNVTFTNSTVATGNSGMLVRTTPRAVPKRTRGWNARTAVRCNNCGRFARLVVEGSSLDRVAQKVNYHIVVECRVCGYEVGFRGRRG